MAGLEVPDHNTTAGEQQQHGTAAIWLANQQPTTADDVFWGCPRQVGGATAGPLAIWVNPEPAKTLPHHHRHPSKDPGLEHTPPPSRWGTGVVIHTCVPLNSVRDAGSHKHKSSPGPSVCHSEVWVSTQGKWSQRGPGTTWQPPGDLGGTLPSVLVWCCCVVVSHCFVGGGRLYIRSQCPLFTSSAWVD